MRFVESSVKKKSLTVIATLFLVAGVSFIASKPSVNAALPGTQLPTLAPMLEQATPAVVNISTHKIVRSRRMRSRSPFDDPFFRYFF